MTWPEALVKVVESMAVVAVFYILFVKSDK